MGNKIHIAGTNNPLMPWFKEILTEEGHTIIKEISSSDLIIAFGYSNKNDIVEMGNMGTLALNKKYTGKRVIFLSWFHPVEDIKHFSHLFTPERATCVLMDGVRFRILQLPVTRQLIINTIEQLCGKEKASHG